MKAQRGFVRAIAACLAPLVLTGCSLLSDPNVEDMLRAPQLSVEYSAIKTALDSYLGENAQLKYPATGDFLSPYLSGDWNGDGTADMVVLYQTSSSANVCLAALQKDENGTWQLAGTAEGLSNTVQSVRLASLRTGEEKQIMVGYSTQGDQYLAVYAYENGELQTILKQPYTQYIVEDITGSGGEDLILLSEDAATEKMQVQLLTAGEDGFMLVQALGLPADQFTGCASISAGRGSDGKTYLVLDGWTGATGTSLASVVLCYDPEACQLETAELPATQDLYTASLRYVSFLTSRDLDGDGIVEIPAQPEAAGQLNLSQDKRLDFVVWRDFTSPDSEKSFGLLDEEYGYYIELPTLWQGNLLLTDGEAEGSVELRNLSGEELYLTLRVASQPASGWFRLGTVASGQIQVRLGPDAGTLTLTKLSQSLYLL